MRSVKLSIIHPLQPHHPSISEIDSDDLNEVIHDAIDEYLDELAEELSEDPDDNDVNAE